jgi:hypothetical protein
VRIGRGLAFHVPSGALGVSYPYAQAGVSATIFQERVEGVCQGAGLDFALMLGYAIAHWGKAYFDQAAPGRLGFTSEQGADIRAYGSRVEQQAECRHGRAAW